MRKPEHGLGRGRMGWEGKVKQGNTRNHNRKKKRGEKGWAWIEGCRGAQSNRTKEKPGRAQAHHAPSPPAENRGTKWHWALRSGLRGHGHCEGERNAKAAERDVRASDLKTSQKHRYIFKSRTHYTNQALSSLGHRHPFSNSFCCAWVHQPGKVPARLQGGSCLERARTAFS